MKTLQSPRATYAAAFILGALIALLLVRPTRAAEPFRLDRVGVVRFTPAADNQLVRQAGVLRLDGTTTWRPGVTLARPSGTPDWALNRPLIPRLSWSAYYALGSGALAGFKLEEGAVTIWIGQDEFHAIAPDPETSIYNGRLLNLSTRGVLREGLDELVGGFVIEDRPRVVLLRVIGPGLATFGIAQPAPDPYLTLKQQGQTVAENDNWSNQPSVALVTRAITRSGAFPLAPGSRDAALVVLLPPGAYTVHATAAAPSFNPGAVMIEIYTLPDDVLFDPVAL